VRDEKEKENAICTKAAALKSHQIQNTKTIVER
jgi:hypothetical protein